MGQRPPALWSLAIAAALWGAAPAAADRDLTEIQELMDDHPEALIRTALFGDTKQDKYDKYNPNVRPVTNHSEAVDVKIGLALKKVLEVDITKGVVTLHVWLRAQWEDPRLYWNPEEYGGLDQITAWVEDVWLPDWIAYDTVEVFEENVRHAESKLYVYSSGEVYWSRPAVMKLTIEGDVFSFPFDTQTIRMDFGSWSQSGRFQDLHVAPYTTYSDGEVNDGRVDLTPSSKSTEFTISTRSAQRELRYYACCKQTPWPTITFYLDLTRKPAHYIKAVILPTVFTTVISFTTFALPQNRGERIGLGITCVLVIFASMFVSTDLLPATDEDTVLGNLYLGCFFYTLGALLATVFISTLDGQSQSMSLTFFVRHVMLGLTKKEAHRLSRTIDLICGAVFPVTFLGFCCIVLMPWLTFAVRVVISVSIMLGSALLFMLCYWFYRTSFVQEVVQRSSLRLKTERENAKNEMDNGGDLSPRSPATHNHSDF